MKLIKKALDFACSNKIKSCLIILLASSILALLSAYISQYIFGFEPCVLCFYQRKPFFFILAFSIFGLLAKKESWQKWLIFAGLAMLLINVGIAFYHSGVEKKIFAGPKTCSSGDNLNEISDLDQLAKAIENTAAIRCDEPQFFLLGLTMAQWNFFYCLGLFGIVMNLVASKPRKKTK